MQFIRSNELLNSCGPESRNTHSMANVYDPKTKMPSGKTSNRRAIRTPQSCDRCKNRKTKVRRLSSSSSGYCLTPPKVCKSQPRTLRVLFGNRCSLCCKYSSKTETLLSCHRRRISGIHEDSASSLPRSRP